MVLSPTMLMIRNLPLTASLAAALAISACGNRTDTGAIPRREMKEIRVKAFQYGERYVISDAEIEKRYKPPNENPCEAKGRTLAEELECLGERAEVRVPAVAGIRGVQLTPTSRHKCEVKFDFEPSKNLHAEFPDSSAIAERFETREGAYYWRIY